MNKSREMHNQGKKTSRRRAEVAVKPQVSKESSPIQDEQDYHFPNLKIQTPLQLIDDVFIGLDRISRSLNESSRKAIDQSIVSDLEKTIINGHGLSLQEIHNLQYPSRLSYIAELSQKKWSKSKHLNGILRMIEGEIKRCEALYFEYTDNYEYLQEIRKNIVISIATVLFLQKTLLQSKMMKSQEDKPASFIGKLCNILRSKQYAKIICWDTEHRGIRILNQKKLQQIILPKYFRHNRFSSFVRQLNMYDFHKVQMENRSFFTHAEFDQKKKENIHLIRRKVTFEQKNQSQREQYDESNFDSKVNKENYSNFDSLIKSSRKMMHKNSINILQTERNVNSCELSIQSTLLDIINQLQTIKHDKNQLIQKINQLKKDKKYSKFLQNKKFLKKLYERLSIDMQGDDDCLSQLSIQDQLLYKTRKSLAPRSMKWLQSGPIQFRRQNTIGKFLNL